MSKPIAALRVVVAALDEDDTPITRSGALYSFTDPGEYDVEYVAGTASDTAAALVRDILGQGQS